MARQSGFESWAELMRLQKLSVSCKRVDDASRSSLETLDFWQVAGITDARVAHLAGLPQLRRLSIDGSPKVTREAYGLFRAGVDVRLSG